MTAGCSGTPLARKLGIKNADRVLPVDAPKAYRTLPRAASSGVAFLSWTDTAVAIAHVFAMRREDLIGRDLWQRFEYPPARCHTGNILAEKGVKGANDRDARRDTGTGAPDVRALSWGPDWARRHQPGYGRTDSRPLGIACQFRDIVGKANHSLAVLRRGKRWRLAVCENHRRLARPPHPACTGLARIRTAGRNDYRTPVVWPVGIRDGIVSWNFRMRVIETRLPGQPGR